VVRHIIPGSFLFLLSACAESGDASCMMRERVDDHNIYSCSEGPNLDSDEFQEFEDGCASIPGHDYYVDGDFENELCSRQNIVGGCDLGGGRRLWYYPNELGWPMFEDMEVLCVGLGLEVVPPP